jgi:hypothetical protein
MAGKKGRPKKEGKVISVDLDENEKREIKDAMIWAIRGEKVGEMDPLTPKAFSDLVIFALGKPTSSDNQQDNEDKDKFKVEGVYE